MKRLLFFLLLFFLIQPAAAYNTIDIPLVAEYGRGTINAMVWNPAGDVLAVASGNGLWFYDAEFNTLGHWGDSNITELAWNENGDYLATAFLRDDGLTISILDNNLEVLFSASHERVSNIRFAWHDERLAYSFDYDAIDIVEAPNFLEIRQISNNYPFLSLAWSPDGNQILGVNREALWLWELETGEIVANYAFDNEDASDGYQYFRETVLWDAERLSVLCVTGDYYMDYHLCNWDWVTNTLSWSEAMSYSSGYIGAFTFLSSDEYFFISYQLVYPNILMWRSSNGQVAILHERDIAAYALHPNGETMSIGTRTGELIQYNLDQQAILREAILHTFEVNDLAWHPSDGRLAIAGHGINYNVQILQLESDENLVDTGIAIPLEISEHVGWSGDGTRLYVGGESYGDSTNLWNYAIYDTANYEQIEWLAGQDDGSYPPPSERQPSHTGDLEAVHDNEAEAIQISNGVVLPLPSSAVRLMSWSPDNKYFAAIISEGVRDGTRKHLFVWDSQTWELVRHEQWGSHYDHSNFSWSPDSQYITYSLTSYYLEENVSPNLRFIAMPNAPELPSLPTDLNSRILWNTDGSILLVQNMDSVDFYIIPSQALVASIDGWYSRFDWRADGHYLAGSCNGVIFVWDTSALFE